MRILTCNIRYLGSDDGENGWPHRKGICIEIIKSQTPDIICFQEMWELQYIDISAAFPDFKSYAMIGEPTGRKRNNAIFFRRDRFAQISAGGYWLSEEPYVAGTKSWDSIVIRLVNWIRLEDQETKTEFRIINTHLDCISQTARENQARMIVEDSSAYPEDYCQVLTGDMNCDCKNKAIDTFKAGGWTDTYGVVHGPEDPGHTSHKFLGPKHKPKDDEGKIDWIFYRGKMKALGAEVIKETRNGRYPSDHYFLSADIVAEDGPTQNK